MGSFLSLQTCQRAAAAAMSRDWRFFAPPPSRDDEPLAVFAEMDSIAEAEIDPVPLPLWRADAVARVTEGDTNADGIRPAEFLT